MTSFFSKLRNLLYSFESIGLCFVLFAIILLHLPSVIFGSVFFSPISDDEANYYGKFGSIFTAIGAIFTIINTVLVIFLMYFFHKRETALNMLPYLSELRKSTLNLESTLTSELEYFEDKQYNSNESIYYCKFDPTGYEEHTYGDAYRREVKEFDRIIREIEKLYSNFMIFKASLNDHDFNYSSYKEKSNIINALNECIVLKKPSFEYNKAFLHGNKHDVEPEDMIETGANKALQSIKDMINILNESNNTDKT